MAAKKKYSLPENILQELDDLFQVNPTAYHKELLKVETDLTKEVQARLKAFSSKYKYCSACKKYYLKKNEKRDQTVELVHGVCVYRDCGYGDDDEYADVTYAVTYSVCPLCHKHNEKLFKHTLGESNRRSRYG